MNPTTKDGIKLLINLPDGEKKETRFAQPSLVKACRGNEDVAGVLDYFIYAASREAKEKGLPESCKVVTVTRTHEKIMQGLQRTPSRKTLIRYLDLLNEWKLVLSQRYHREFTIDLDSIQQAINNPPQPEPSIRQSKPREKGCRSTTLQPLDLDYEKVVRLYQEMAERVTTLEVEAAKKVVDLQQKVVTLQQKVVDLQLNVDKLQHYNVTLDGSTPALNGPNFPLPLYTFILPLYTSKESVVTASADHPLLSFQNLGINDVTVCVAFDDWWMQRRIIDEANDAHHMLPTKNQTEVETQSASYRPTEEDHERSSNDSLAPSIPAHPDPARAEVNSLHTDAYQDIVAPPQQGEVTPTSGEMPQAHQLDLQASDNEPEKPVQATRGGRKGSVKGDASTTRVGGNTVRKSRYQITLQGQHIIDLYQELRKRRITLTEGNIKAANGLADVVDSDEDFRDVFRMIQEDPFLNQNDVKRDLDFIYRKYDGYIDKVEKARSYAKNPTSKKPNPSTAETPQQSLASSYPCSSGQYGMIDFAKDPRYNKALRPATQVKKEVVS